MLKPFSNVFYLVVVLARYDLSIDCLKICVLNDNLLSTKWIGQNMLASAEICLRELRKEIISEN